MNKNKDIYFHGSIEDIQDSLNRPINWITKDFNYAKTFALNSGYVYKCSTTLGNLLNVGKTDARVFDLLPIKPYKFSKEFNEIVTKLNVDEKIIRDLASNVAKNFQVNEYKLKIKLVVNTLAFKNILKGLGYNGIKAIEYDSINHKDVETYGIFDSVKIVDKESVKESLSEAKAITWGDLDYAKKTDTRKMMSGRGTGHFGTGFYFVGANGPYGLEGDKFYDYAPDRPIYEIDLDKYKLFRPRDNEEAYKLHDAMRNINNYYNDDMYNFLFSNFDANRVEDELYSVDTKAQKVYEDINDDFDDLDIDDLEDTTNDLEDDSNESQDVKDKLYEKRYRELVLEFIKKYGLESYIYNPNYNTLEDWLTNSRIGIIEREVKEAIHEKEKYLDYVKYAITNLSNIFSVDKYKLLAMIKANSRLKSNETISTLIFKDLGYEGVDVTHLNHDAQGLSGLDNFSYGTVIYDLKPGTFKKIVDPRKKRNESLVESTSVNTFIYKGKKCWCGAVNTLDGTIEEVHSYEDAQEYDFHHSFYFSDSQIDKMDEGLSCFFYISSNHDIIIDAMMRYSPQDSEIKFDEDFLKNRIKEQIKFIDNESLEEKIVKKGNKWQVQSEKGRNLGTYNTKKEAEKRLQQVHYFKHMSEEVEIKGDEFSFTLEDICKKYPDLVSNSYQSCGPAFIMPDGKYLLSGKRFDMHGDLAFQCLMDIEGLSEQEIENEFDTSNLTNFFTRFFKLIRVNDGSKGDVEDRAYFVIPYSSITSSQMNSLQDFVDYILKNKYSKKIYDIQAFVGTNYAHQKWDLQFNNPTSDEIIDDVKFAMVRGFFGESLKEYLDKVDSYSGTDIYVTDSAYQLKNLLEKGDKPYRIYYWKGAYYFCSALGDMTHNGMMQFLFDKGYADGKGFDEWSNNNYMVFIPKNFDADLMTYDTSLGSDDYYYCRVYDIGVMYVRDPYTYKNSLFEALGEPEREIFYNEYDMQVEITKNDKTTILDVRDINYDVSDAFTIELESLREDYESKDEILAFVEKNIGTSDKPIDGPSYILPNGKFLTIWKSKIPVSKYSSSGSATHRDVQQFLYVNGLVKDDFWNCEDPDLERLGCIRVNSGFEEYIWLPDNRPNETQWNSLLTWLDWYFAFHKKLTVGYYHYAPKIYFASEYTTDEILKKCKEAYARGYLIEDLTKEQEEYFKNSKIRDEKGNLLVCYHGTETPGFTEFDARKGKSQFGDYKFDNYNINYFTTNKETAIGYTEIGVERDNNVYACYLNIVNPYVVNNKTEDDMYRTWQNIKDETIRNKEIDYFKRFYNKWSSRNISEKDLDELNKDLFYFNCKFVASDEDNDYYDLISLNDNTMFGSAHPLMYYYELSEYFDKDNYEEFRNSLVGDYEGEDKEYFRYTIDNLIRWVLLMNEEEGTNYDGIIVPEIYDIGPKGSPFMTDKTTDIITLKSSNQIKKIDNLKPTSSSNINEEVNKYYRLELEDCWRNRLGLFTGAFEAIPTKETIENYPEDFKDLTQEERERYYRFDELLNELSKIKSPGVDTKLQNFKEDDIFAFTDSKYNEILPIIKEMRQLLKEMGFKLIVKELDIDDANISYRDDDQVAFSKSNSSKYINESKQDIEKFRQWAGDELANRFFKLKDRLPDRAKDIYYWMGNEKQLLNLKDRYKNAQEHSNISNYEKWAHEGAIDSLKSALDNVEQTPTRREINKLGKEGSKKIYEDDNWLVLKINTYEASVKYGKGTEWCITGNNSDQGRIDFNHHTLDSGATIYFFINKKNKSHKYALEYINDNDWCLFDETDFPHVGYGNSFKRGVNSMGGEHWYKGDARDTFPTIKGLPDINKAYDYFETLEESLNDDKVLRLPNKATSDMINALKDYYKDIHLEVLPIDKLVKDNDLLNDDDLQSYHQGEWNHALAKDFHIDQDKVNNIKMSNVPFVIKKKDGTLAISDGRHRTRAAYNDGYTHVEYPTYKEE